MRTHQRLMFVEFLSEADDADYTTKIMILARLRSGAIRTEPTVLNTYATYDIKFLDTGALLFIDNLDHKVNKEMLYMVHLLHLA
jgi:hypothetical protein